MRRTATIVLASLLGAAAASAAPADAASDTLVVTGRPLVAPTRETTETVATGTEVTREGLDAMGLSAAASVYQAIDLLPGLSVTGADAYGLSVEQRGVRTRGVRSILGALTFAGVPNYGGNPMGPRDYVVDVENLAGIAVYQGAVPSGLATGVGARGGVIDLRPIWARQQAAAQVTQALGASSYRRTFLRVDSGQVLAGGPLLAFSASHTGADKWKGAGESGPRRNLAFTASQALAPGDTLRVWFNDSDVEQHLYRPLSWDEVQDLAANYHLDHAAALTGDRAADIDFYDFNRGHYRNHDLLIEAPWTLSRRLRVTATPYWSREDTEIFQGAPTQGGVVAERSRDIERHGVSARLVADLGRARAVAGLWYESLDMDIATANTNPVTRELVSRSVGVVSDEDAISLAPFLQLSGVSDAWSWQAGLKYHSYAEPRSQGLVYPAPDFIPQRAPDLTRQARTYRAWLPNVGLSRAFGPDAAVTLSYGRSNIRPYAYLPLINLYNRSRAAFQAAGVTLDDLFAGYAMETSDSAELGGRLRHDRLDVRASLYASWHHDLLTTVHDPRVDLSYGQNVGAATGRGVELMATLQLHDAVSIFCNPAYTHLTYDDDLSYQGAVLDAAGNQVVATPRWSVKAGALLAAGPVELVPLVRYLGERFADVEHRERVDGSLLADLRVSWRLGARGPLRQVQANLDVMNILDEQAVSVINASDDSRAGTTSFLVAAPRTVAASVAVGF